MEEIIKKLISLDDRAKEIVAEARASKADVQKAVEAQSQKLHAELYARAQKKVDQLFMQEQAYLQEKLSAIMRERDEKMAKMEAEFREKKDSWIEDAAKAVIDAV